MIKIILDCFGGDKGVKATVAGAATALKRFDDLFLVLTGDEEILNKEAAEVKLPEGRYSILHASGVVGCDEKPTDVVRHRADTSLMKGIELLRAGEADGMVSVGSSGALIAAAMMRVGRLKGVIRPAFCPLLPAMTGGIVGVCDSGANVDCTPERLRQFAVMGSLYLKNVFGIENPRVALLNVGVEAEKGDLLRKNTYPLLEATECINFVGNMESRDLISGKYDLVVCDGFSGNVLVKSTEGAGLQLLKKLKSDISASFKNKIGALFLRKMFMQEKEFMNYQNYGGSVLLGTKKTVVKGHGSSNAVAVAKCIEQAYRMEASKMNLQIQECIAAIGSKEEKE